MFLTPEEDDLTNEYLGKGFVIRASNDKASLEWIRQTVFDLSKTILEDTSDDAAHDWLNKIHNQVPVSELNDFRVRLIHAINEDVELRVNYYRVARALLDPIVGNELAMQMRVNLSIQYPDDASSLLPIHADVWSGDSPFEVVVWIPLVDCFKTKSMFLLPPKETEELHSRFSEFRNKTDEDIFREYEEKMMWIEIKYGEVLLFNQNLPHGNRVNRELETRWSLNCRFKSILSPYGDKKLGEFFEPITMRAATRIGIKYDLPGAKP